MKKTTEDDPYVWLDAFEIKEQAKADKLAATEALTAEKKRLNTVITDLRDDLASTRQAFLKLTKEVSGGIGQGAVTLADTLLALAPFAHLGPALDYDKGKDHTIFVGQVIRGETSDEDKHHPIFYWNLRHAAMLFRKLESALRN